MNLYVDMGVYMWYNIGIHRNKPSIKLARYVLFCLNFNSLLKHEKPLRPYPGKHR